MFTLDIKAFQKRWAEITGDGTTVFRTRTTIDTVEVSDPEGRQGTVGVQKEMFLNKFAGTPSLEFVDGILVDIEDASVRPHRMLYTKVLGGETLMFSDNYERTDLSSVTDPSAYSYSPPFSLLLEFSAGTYDWTYTPVSGSPVYGFNEEYSEEPVLLIGSLIDDPGADADQSTGLMAVVPAKPSGVTEWNSSTEGENPFGLSSKIEFEGAWTKDSYDDGSYPLIEPGVKITSDGTGILTFTFRKSSGDLSYTMPWNSFKDGDWVELVDPDSDDIIADRDPAGVKVRFGGGAVTSEMDPPSANTRFECAFLDAGDTIQEWLDSLLYFRPIDVVDLEGSLSRYDELGLFYKSPRWVMSPSGLPVLYTLQQDESTEEYSWDTFTGIIDVGSDPFVRCFQCIDAFSEVVDANTEAQAVISALTSFKDNYTDFLNESFSTDTDEYPDSEEEFDI